MLRGVKIALITSTAIGLSGLSLGIEQPLLTASIAADQAQRHHVSDYLGQMSEEASRIEELSRLTTQQLGIGNQIASEIQNYITCEITRGCISDGPAGPGPITDTLKTILGGFSAMQNGIQKQNTGFGNLLETSRKKIEEARVAYNEGNDKAFNEAIAVLHASLSRARGEAGKITFDTSLLANSGFAQIAQLADRFDVAESGPLSTGFGKPIPVFEPMDAYEATVVYSDKVFVAHVLATCVCLLPLVLFFILLVSAVTRKEDDDDDGFGGHQSQEPTYPGFGSARAMAAE